MAESGQQFYDEEEAEQILRLASSMSSPLGAMSREQLMQTAAELGISPEAVQMAEKQVASSRIELTERAEFDRRIRRDFYGQLASYVIVNGFLVSMNLYIGGYFWAAWPLLGWGIGIAFCFVETFIRNTESYQEEFEKWRKKRNRLQNRESSTAASSDFVIDKFIRKRSERGRQATRMEAITYLCRQTGMMLKEGREAVDQYMLRNPGMLE